MRPEQRPQSLGRSPRRRVKPGLRTRRWVVILGTSLFFSLALLLGISAANKSGLQVTSPQNNPVSNAGQISEKRHEEHERDEDDDDEHENDDDEHENENRSNTPTATNWSAVPSRTVTQTTQAKSHGS